MSCIGIGGSVIAVSMILMIVRPVYDGMYQDVFLKIGGNGNMWGMYEFFNEQISDSLLIL